MYFDNLFCLVFEMQCFFLILEHLPTNKLPFPPEELASYCSHPGRVSHYSPTWQHSVWLCDSGSVRGNTQHRAQGSGNWHHITQMDLTWDKALSQGPVFPVFKIPPIYKTIYFNLDIVGK